MKLTINIREAFVRAAMDDVPSINHSEEIRKLAMEDAIAALPPSVAKAYKDPKTREYIKLYGHTFGGVTVMIPCFEEQGWRSEKVRPLSADVKTKVDALALEMKAQKETHNSLRAKLVGAANSCTTRKQLVELLPEFDKYLPADNTKATKMNLPAIANVLTDFVKAGWPKDRKKIVI